MNNLEQYGLQRTRSGYTDTEKVYQGDTPDKQFPDIVKEIKECMRTYYPHITVLKISKGKYTGEPVIRIQRLPLAADYERWERQVANEATITNMGADIPWTHPSIKQGAKARRRISAEEAIEARRVEYFIGGFSYNILERLGCCQRLPLEKLHYDKKYCRPDLNIEYVGHRGKNTDIFYKDVDGRMFKTTKNRFDSNSIQIPSEVLAKAPKIGGLQLKGFFRLKGRLQYLYRNIHTKEYVMALPDTKRPAYAVSKASQEKWEAYAYEQAYDRNNELASKGLPRLTHEQTMQLVGSLKQFCLPTIYNTETQTVMKTLV